LLITLSIGENAFRIRFIEPSGKDRSSYRELKSRLDALLRWPH